MAYKKTSLKDHRGFLLIVQPLRSAIREFASKLYLLDSQLLVEQIDSKEFLNKLFAAMYADLPAPKKKISAKRCPLKPG